MLIVNDHHLGPLKCRQKVMFSFCLPISCSLRKNLRWDEWNNHPVKNWRALMVVLLWLGELLASGGCLSFSSMLGSKRVSSPTSLPDFSNNSPVQSSQAQRTSRQLWSVVSTGGQQKRLFCLSFQWCVSSLDQILPELRLAWMLGCIGILKGLG